MYMYNEIEILQARYKQWNVENFKRSGLVSFQTCNSITPVWVKTSLGKTLAAW